MENTLSIAARTASPDALAGQPSPTAKPEEAASGADFFWNLLDVINPLQHIPVISTIYRALTGDEISPAAKLAGGALFGGPLGAAAAIASIAVEETTGSDVGELVYAAITGEGAPAPENQLAQAPVLAQAPAPAQTAALRPAGPPEPPRDTIIWNGVRQRPLLASLTGPPPALESTPGDPNTVIEPAAIAATTLMAPPPKAQSATRGTNTEPDPAAPTVPQNRSAATANPSAAWLTTALTQAESVESANARGDTSLRLESQPWLADAMMQALDQYESLAKRRQGQAGGDNTATAGNTP